MVFILFCDAFMLLDLTLTICQIKTVPPQSLPLPGPYVNILQGLSLMSHECQWLDLPLLLLANERE